MKFRRVGGILAHKKLLYAGVYRHNGTNPHKWVEPMGYDTGIHIHNTATKRKVPLILRQPTYLTWYMCGPTVYDSAHIGHACCYVKFDIIRRIIENFFNICVVQVMGITDVDDKIIKRAAELQQDTKFLTVKYEREFFIDMASLNVEPPTVTVRVTDVVPNIILFIEKIVSKGMAYIVENGSVYFDTVAYNRYGKLCPASDDVARDENESREKKSPRDFALWKSVKPGEPSWSSPWGKGRPGWHIECSTIASNILGPVIDMHSGGIDLLFPHHENEEAQSCSYHNVDQWINYWLHSGHLHLKNDQKMSKSLKNTISIEEFLASNTSDHFRMFCLLSGYRNNVEFTDASLDQAKVIYKRINSFLGDCNSYVRGYTSTGCVNTTELLEKLLHAKKELLSALADDFDTPRVINILIDLISYCNKMLHAEPSGPMEQRNPAAVAAVATYIRQTVSKLGIHLTVSDTSIQDDMNSAAIVDMVVNFRSQVREMALENLKSKVVKDNANILKACDQLRENLNTVGIEIKDLKGRSSWNMRK